MTFDDVSTPKMKNARKHDIEYLSKLARPITPIKGPPPAKELGPTIPPLSITKNGEVNLVSRLTEDAVRRSKRIVVKQLEKERKLDEEFAEKQSLHHNAQHDETTFLRLTSPRKLQSFESMANAKMKLNKKRFSATEAA